jgi:hypothetical protein
VSVAAGASGQVFCLTASVGVRPSLYLPNQ